MYYLLQMLNKILTPLPAEDLKRMELQSIFNPSPFSLLLQQENQQSAVAAAAKAMLVGDSATPMGPPPPPGPPSAARQELLSSQALAQIKHSLRISAMLNEQKSQSHNETQVCSKY